MNEQAQPASESLTGVRYTRTAVTLHWVIAALIVTNICLGLIAGHSVDQWHRYALDFHKPIGISVLVLSAVRLVWRLTHKPPPLSTPTRALERRLSQIVHASFYCFMILLPLTGWLLSSAVPNRHPIGLPGIFTFPFLPIAQSLDNAKAADGAHVVLAYSAIAAIALHLAGVVKHELIDGDHIVTRMFWRKVPPSTQIS